MSKLQFFNDVYAKIQASCPSIKTVRLYNSQLTNFSKEESMCFPAAFIEMSGMDWEVRGKGIQQGNVMLTVHVVTESYKTDDLTFLNIVDEVYVGLNGYEESYFTPLTRESERQDINHDQLSQWDIVFRTTFYDCQDNYLEDKILKVTPTSLRIITDFDIDNDIIRTGDGDFNT